MKKIIITGGPTNEPIDEVMKITNMSTGSLSVNLGEMFLMAGYQVCLILNHGVNAGKLEGTSNQVGSLEIVRVETTDDMMQAFLTQSKKCKYDVVIHASAVGDYKAEFSFLMEDLAEELFLARDKIRSAADILAIMESPKCKLDDSSKISSYQKNLTVKLGLTPKVIARLREWYPDSILVGCKLLENVPKEELFQVAQHLCEKNHMDYIMANDLEDLRNGLTARYVVTEAGYEGIKLETPKNIFEFVNRAVK